MTSYLTFYPLTQAARLEADYRLWLEATDRKDWYPEGTRTAFVYSRLSDFSFMEVRMRPIDSKKARWGFPSLVEAKEFKRRHLVHGEIVQEGRKYFIRSPFKAEDVVTDGHTVWRIVEIVAKQSQAAVIYLSGDMPEGGSANETFYRDLHTFQYVTKKVA